MPYADEINASFAEWVLDHAKSRSLSPTEVVFELTKRVARTRTVSVPLTTFVKAGDRREVFDYESVAREAKIPEEKLRKLSTLSGESFHMTQ